MALLEIITVPDPRLREVSLPVKEVDADIRTLMNNMTETLFHIDGVGLAAPQVGVLKRVIVVDKSANGVGSPEALCMANPQILWASAETQTKKEGCFSVPGSYEEVERPLELRVAYLDQNNTPQELHARDLVAHCIHHEIEHLDGTLFVDHLSTLKRQLILKRAKKGERVR